jgi:GT2 family glycosyltransferase
MNATIVIPVHNQLHFTRQCLESLNAAGYPDTMIVVVDNASTDGTAEYLAARPNLRVIQNQENRACAAAWNQGFQASRTNWTLFLNNDVVVPRGWLEALLAFAEQDDAQIVSPAMAEGELDYNLQTYADDFMARMKDVVRRGTAFGAAFVVARAVFSAIGGFDEKFTRGGNEDDDFFWRARNAGFRLAVTGSSYFHHFGNMTQKVVVAVRGSHRAETIGYFRAKWKTGWIQRRWQQMRRRVIEFWWAKTERLRYGHTLREQRIGGAVYFR